MRTETRFLDFTSAVRMRIGPSNLPSKFCGSHGSEPVWLASNTSGASLMIGGGRETFFERGGINERLEARAGLAQRLRNVIVFVAREIEAADQRADRAVVGSDRDTSAASTCGSWVTSQWPLSSF